MSSPSQLVAIDRCPRRWWFESVVQLRLPDSKRQNFGHALHKVCAAALAGQPVLKGWDDGLTDEEVERCLELRDRALQKNVLIPRPNLRIEHDFRMPIGEQEIHGVIDSLDLDSPRIIIEDHKSIASAQWGYDEQKLINDIPMMAYAGYAFTQTDKEEAVLRHNQFISDRRDVREVEVTVSKADVRRFWGRRIIPALKKMEAVKTIELWSDVEGHDRKSDACTIYGGCPFMSICHNGMDIKAFGGKAPEVNGAPF